MLVVRQMGGGNDMKKIEVAAAIITHNNEFLCMQRGESKFSFMSYKYEFPGGKLEIGESPVEALKREIKEELNIDLTVDERAFYMTVEHQYPDFYLTMHSFICPVTDRKLEKLEHYNAIWLTADRLGTLDWAAADIPIMEKLSSGIIIEEVD